MLTYFTDAEQRVIDDYEALVSQWRVHSEASLHARGIDTRWLLYGQVDETVVIPLFQFEVVNIDGTAQIVPSLVVQNVNRILHQTRTLTEIGIWWLAVNKFFEELPNTNGETRTGISPRDALCDPELSRALVGAAKRTVEYDRPFVVHDVADRTLIAV